MFKFNKRGGFVTIRQKIILLAIVSTLIPLCSIGTFTFLYFIKVVENKISDTTSNLLSVINWNIDTFEVDVESIAKMVLSSKDIQYYLSDETNDFKEMYKLQTSTRDFLINLANNKSYINSIYVGSDKQEYITINRNEGVHSGNIYQTIIGTEWYQTVKKYDGRGVWFNAVGDASVSGQNLLLFGKLLKNLDTLEPTGILMITVDRNVFDQMFKDIYRVGGDRIIILDYKRVVYNSGSLIGKQLIDDKEVATLSGLPEKGRTTIEISGKKYIVNYSTNERTGWKVVSMIPYESILKEVNIIKGLTILLIVVSFTLAIIGSYLISNRITKQLVLLNKVVNKIALREGIHNYHFKNTDEIGIIGNQFIHIHNMNSDLTIKLYESKIKEKEAELLALQSQINPHFLYNTLNSIYWMAEKIKAKNISKMVISLSKFFKLSLNNGSYITTVENEIEQIRNYLEIQNIRYDNKLIVSIEVEPSILKEKVIKLLIQPLVENAIYHGLELKEGEGHITIRGMKKEHVLVFEVIDDGIGFDTEHISAKSKGYALKNIEERIKLHYGESYGISVESEPLIGTKAVITVGIIS
ncbi:sensor histidine kinase [Paenibacillus sp. FSL H7-0331]|uniref:sensor histidine kinase n=1 Tax=Paenibacillus sp. FSL H7-0331 TaxID=1920421 RepID=UPI00096C796B|nr:sensor histidine kinase [Paenibacillus sp. FSL H7-0331]OMF15846.1 hypothetical protein BK127_16140 [Paenibacillus sp. FSL H7-0331]